jgi:hypothetical protein
MTNIVEIEKIITDLKQDFETISMPRSAYVLENLIIKEKDTEPEQWAQCVLEMRVKYINIKRGLLKIERIKLEIAKIQKKELLTDFDSIDIRSLECDLEESQWGLTGLTREFFALHRIYQQFGRRYNREELDTAQEEYWGRRLTRQAIQDILTTGAITQGNQNALRQIGLSARIKEGHVEFIKDGRTGFISQSIQAATR